MPDTQEPRSAQATDLDGVIALAGSKTYVASPSQGLSTEGRKEAALAFLRGLRESHGWRSEFDLFVTDGAEGITGFLVLKKHLSRYFGSVCESFIRDCFAPHESDHRSLLEFAVEMARGYDSQFLAIEIAPPEKNQQKVLLALGFQPESHRISVATAEHRSPEGSPYSVRLAAEEDYFAIAMLNSQMIPHMLCAGRDHNVEELVLLSLDATFQQLNRDDPNIVALVLTKDEEFVGHLILELTQNPQTAYINDVCVAQEHWGGKAFLQIMRAGSQLLFQRNIPLLVGDVSATNLRVLKISQRNLGFSVECDRYSLKL